MADVKITLDIAKATARLENAAEKSVFVVTEQALADCNQYCKQDQGGLIDSSLTHSEPEKGIMRWKTPYARLQYYLDAVRKDINKFARKMWAHHAASVHGTEWLEMMQAAFSKFSKEK